MTEDKLLQSHRRRRGWVMGGVDDRVVSPLKSPRKRRPVANSRLWLPIRWSCSEIKQGSGANPDASTRLFLPHQAHPLFSRSPGKDVRRHPLGYQSPLSDEP